MNKLFLSTIIAMLPAAAMSQTAIDAYQLSRYDLRGTARFMSMGGAFGALGGDLSTLNQNPGGIGVYRRSEIGLTFDINLQSANAQSSIASNTTNHTNFLVNNVGYVGTANTGSDLMPNINWGFSYGRQASFNRRYKGTVDMNGSLSSYIAGYTSKEGWSSDLLSASEGNYWSFDHAPWMSLLAYNSYMINPIGSGNKYSGLWQNGSTYGVSDFTVDESGYVDEYEINLGGNFADVVYWGIGIGINDIEYNQNIYYEEYLNNACIPVEVTDAAGNVHVEAGQPTKLPYDVWFGLDSRKRISGTGYNFKIGVIVKPINELRFGLAFHTPTVYNLTQTHYADVDYDYGYSDIETDANYSKFLQPGYAGTPEDYINWKLHTPWRMIASVAGVIGSKAIISADYEYRPYNGMKFNTGDAYSDDILKQDVKDYYKSVNILRIGAEYRLSSQFSLRAGYAFESSPVTDNVKNDQLMVYTSNPEDTGVTPSYTLDNSTSYITCGLGYRYKNFSIDAAYVHKTRKSDYHPYTPNEYTYNPDIATITSNDNNIVLSFGYKF